MNNNGFSLAEMIITTVIMGIISGLCYFAINDTGEKAIATAAKVKAHVLNSAKISYSISESIEAKEYYNKMNNEAKYIMLKKYMPMSEDSLKLFSGEKCEFVLEDLDNRVQLFIKGKRIEY